MRIFVFAIVAATWLHPAALRAEEKPSIDPARIDAMVKAAFPSSPQWQERLAPDETMKQCSASANSPAKSVGEQIQRPGRGQDQVSG
jgi:sulfur-oxidizing protein SoxX